MRPPFCIYCYSFLKKHFRFPIDIKGSVRFPLENNSRQQAAWRFLLCAVFLCRKAKVAVEKEEQQGLVLATRKCSQLDSNCVCAKFTQEDQTDQHRIIKPRELERNSVCQQRVLLQSCFPSPEYQDRNWHHVVDSDLQNCGQPSLVLLLTDVQGVWTRGIGLTLSVSRGFKAQLSLLLSRPQMKARMEGRVSPLCCLSQSFLGKACRGTGKLSLW